MSPGKLRHDAQNWQPHGRRRCDCPPEEDAGSLIVAMLGFALVGIGGAIVTYEIATLVIWWLR
jgi:hypothetical protein